MTAQTARSRRITREKSIIRRVPPWLKWLAIGFLLLLVVDVLLVSNWVMKSGGWEKIELFSEKPQRVYLPLMFSNPTVEPKLVQQATETVEYVLSEYKIQAGDTLYDIAMAHKISLDLLLAVNPALDRKTILAIGDMIYIPPEGLELADIPPMPTPTNQPTKTPTPLQTETATVEATTASIENTALSITPTKKPPPALAERVNAINGVPIEKIIVLPPEVIEHMREVYATGQAKGRNPQAFAKIGDSTIESPFFMDRFDSGPYNLGEYAYLQKAINFFAGSFARQGPSVRRGMHAWTLFDSMWTDYDVCRSGESPVECEFRIQNPGFVFIRLGSNDAGRSDLFTSSMKKLIEMCLNGGIIPILGTKADRIEGDNENNEIIRDLADDYDVPLWDFDRVAQTLPNNGVGEDGVHLTIFYPHDYTLPEALQTGYGVHTITALMMLYELWRNLVKS